MLRDYLSNYSDSDLRALVRDYERFEKESAIGDCFLRQTANEFMESINMPDHNVVFIMEKIAFESFRRLAGY